MTTISAHRIEELAKFEITLSGDVTLSPAFTELVYGDSTHGWTLEVDNKSGYNTAGYYEIQQPGDYYINGNFNVQSGSGLTVMEFRRLDSSGNLDYQYRAVRTNNSTGNQAEGVGYIFMDCVVGDRLQIAVFNNSAPVVIEGDLGAGLRKTVMQVRQLPKYHMNDV